MRAFGYTLNQFLGSLNLDPNIVREIRSNEDKLGGLVPSNQDTKTTAMLRSAVNQAFAFGCRIIMALCAALALGCHDCIVDDSFQRR
jgi:hypothetical protein